MLDLIINSSLAIIFPENQIKKIIDLKKDFGYKLLQRLVIDNKINLQSNNIKEFFFIQKCFQRN